MDSHIKTKRWQIRASLSLSRREGGSLHYFPDDPDSIVKKGSLQKSSWKEVRTYLLSKFVFLDDFHESIESGPCIPPRAPFFPWWHYLILLNYLGHDYTYSWYLGIIHFRHVTKLSRGDFSTPCTPLYILCKLRVTKMSCGAHAEWSRWIIYSTPI